MEKLIKQIQQDGKRMVERGAARRIYKMVKATNSLDGDVAEVGVYMGGTAKIICEATDKPVHLFDTFEGLPVISEQDDVRFHEGDYTVSLPDVKKYLNYPNVNFYKGVFPGTAESVKNKRFAFVHLDVDLYKSTIDCLEFFYPKLVRGGIILSHDYPRVSGVKKAFDEFFVNKTEKLHQLTYNQCSIVKK